jgi:hypothetical protein
MHRDTILHQVQPGTLLVRRSNNVGVRLVLHDFDGRDLLDDLYFSLSESLQTDIWDTLTFAPAASAMAFRVSYSGCTFGEK